MNESRTLELLASAAQIPRHEWRKRYPASRPMGYLCSYVPEEIIHAAGFSPIRIRGNSAPLHQVDAHLQSFVCALCRSTLDQALGGDLNGLAGTVFAHTCDAMQALVDLWRMNQRPERFVDVVMQPTNLGTPAARPYLIAELGRFRAYLAAFSGEPITDDTLKESIDLFDETRRLARALQGRRSRLTAPQFFAVLDAAQAMPRELYNPLLAELLRELENAPARARGPRLFLVGAVLDEPRLLDLVEDVGAQVTGDDLCSGSRHFAGQVGTRGEPVAALADYFLQRPPCPTKLQPEHDPGRHLLSQLDEARADGVVYVIEKFCEPYAFDYAQTIPTLDRSGIPHLVLEMEHTPSLEALRTRLQAFVEML